MAIEVFHFNCMAAMENDIRKVHIFRNDAFHVLEMPNTRNSISIIQLEQMR